MARKNRHDAVSDNSSEEKEKAMNAFDNAYGVGDVNEADINIPEDGSESEVTKEEMEAAFSDAAKDFSETEPEEVNEDEEETKEEAPVQKAVKHELDLVQIQRIVNDEIFANEDSSDENIQAAKIYSPGYLVAILQLRNSILDSYTALSSAHFSEDKDDVFDRAEALVADGATNGVLDMKLENARRLRLEFEAAMETLSNQLKDDLGIKPLSEEEKKVIGESVVDKQKLIKTNIDALGIMNNTLVGDPLNKVIDYVNNLPPLPSITAKGGIGGTKSFGSSNTAGEKLLRPRLGSANGGGAWYKGVHHTGFTTLARVLKSEFKDSSFKAQDITHAILEAHKVSTWTELPTNKETWVTIERNGKTAEIMVIIGIA